MDLSYAVRGAMVAHSIAFKAAFASKDSNIPIYVYTGLLGLRRGVQLYLSRGIQLYVCYRGCECHRSCHHRQQANNG